MAESRNSCSVAGVTPERWKEIEAVFEQALELPTNERTAFLARSCNGDEELRREVDSLLESHASAGSFIDEPTLFIANEDLKDDDEDVPVGQLIGAYRIVREIGRGGMGAVYLAERADEQYRRRVAVKVIKRGMDTDAVLRHFRQERQILADFDHPNIARLFDGGTTVTGLPYFVMEYIEGVPIDQYCTAFTLSIEERLNLFLQVCTAVSYAHRHTVIHRDIKMSNILVTSDGTPKLLDFGIAKILQPGIVAEALVTVTGVRPMTPEYASPEQMRGQAITTASDVYSLGVVLYELLTGRSPYRFTSRSPLDVARAITETEPSKPSTAIRTRESRIENRGSADSSVTNYGSQAVHDSRALRGDLDNIVLMALRKEPARRYQSVEQFAEDIRRHLENRPVLAREDTIGYRARKFVQRNKVATTAAILIFVSLVAGMVATTWQAHRATVQKTRAERRFNDVRQLAHSVLFDYHDAIKDLPGATHARERLVKDALTYLDGLAAEATGDPALQRELAAAYERVGDVRGEAFAASLGDRAGAIESYRKALSIREALVGADPRDLQSRRDLAASHRKMGNELLETSESVRGLQHLRDALAIYSALVAEQPQDLALRRELASIYNDLGLALEDRGDMAGALEQHGKALTLREQLLTADPANAQAQRDLSITYVNTGRALYFTGKVAEATEINSKAIELRKALVAEDATNSDYRRLLAIGYQNDGDYRALEGDVAGALESFGKKMALDRQALAADPANVQTRSDYAYSSERMGVLLLQAGDYSAALPHLLENLQIRENLAANDPGSIDQRYANAIAHAEVAQVQAKLGQSSGALEHYGKALMVLQQTRVDPANMYLRGLEGQAYGWLGRSQRELASVDGAAKAGDHLRSARGMFQRSLDIWQDLQRRSTLAADDVPKLEDARRELANCDAALAGKE